MGVTIIVNGRTVVHKGSGGKAPSVPDFCKTPAPPGPPVPVPYPNLAESKDTADGSKRVKMDGNPIMLKKSKFSTSVGDEAGTLKGVASNTNKGIAKFVLYSFDVKVEGQNVPRLGDPMTNNGNAPNSLTLKEVQALFGVGVTREDGVKICEAFCEAQKEYINGNISGRGCISAEFEKRLAQKGLSSNVMTEVTFVFPPSGAPVPQMLTPSVYNSLRGRISQMNRSLLRGVPINPGGAAGGPVTRNAATRLSGAMRRLRDLTGGPGVGRTRRPDIVTRGPQRELFASDNKFDSFKDRNDPSKGMRRDRWGKGQKPDYKEIDEEGKGREVNADNCKC